MNQMSLIHEPFVTLKGGIHYYKESKKNKKDFIKMRLRRILKKYKVYNTIKVYIKYNKYIPKGGVSRFRRHRLLT